MKENKMDEIKWKNIHIRKEATDYKYERHMNPCKKHRPRLCNFIKILSKTYTTKITLVFNPFSFFRRYIYSIRISQTDIRESKFVTTKGHPLTNS